ncbi:unnamed protein product [Cochlearia groenlandica]
MSHHHIKNHTTTYGFDFHQTKPEFSGLKSLRTSDYESSWSPTSPLDLKLFSSLGKKNPFGGSCSMSIRKGYRKSFWDSCKVGLSIVDSLDDDHHHYIDSSRIVLPSSPDCKNIIFESLMRSINHNDGGSCLVNAFEVTKQSSRSLNGYYTESDIEISEEYTCVISHGPNPKTTRFYGDRVLESVEDNVFEKEKKGCFETNKDSIFVIAPLDKLITSVDDFLSFCCKCSKKLCMEKDIYMYRGYKAFCSSECRSMEIQLDEKMEKEEEEEDMSCLSLRQGLI